MLTFIMAAVDPAALQSGIEGLEDQRVGGQG